MGVSNEYLEYLMRNIQNKEKGCRSKPQKVTEHEIKSSLSSFLGQPVGFVWQVDQRSRDLGYTKSDSEKKHGKDSYENEVHHDEG